MSKEKRPVTAEIIMSNTVKRPAIAALAAAEDLRVATADMCALVGISETDIAEGLESVDIIPAVVAGTPHELVYRRATFVMIETFDRQSKPGVEDVMGRLESARNRLVEALQQENENG